MRRSVELQATNNVFQSGYKMDFWPAAAIMAEDQADGWLAGDGDGRELDRGWDKSGQRCHPGSTLSKWQSGNLALALFGLGDDGDEGSDPPWPRW